MSLPQWDSSYGYMPSSRALSLLRDAASKASGRADLILRYAEALHDSDQLAEARDVLKCASVDFPSDPNIQFLLGRVAADMGDPILAISALRNAIEGGIAAAAGELADALYDAGSADEALEVASQELMARPDNSRAFVVAANVLAAQGQFYDVLELCRRLRSRTQHWTRILVAEVAAAAIVGDNVLISQLVDREHWFADAVLPTSADFSKRLAEEILGSKALSASRAVKATAGKEARIRQLSVQGGPLVQELLEKIRVRISSYIEERAGFNHPMMAHVPPRLGLNAWALVLENDGHERWHMHPSSWISGVYYVRVPERLHAGGDKAGAIGFGPLPLPSGASMDSIEFPRWQVQPREGQLLMFPSYFAHRTWPTGSSEPRICVAFDAVPIR